MIRGRVFVTDGAIRRTLAAARALHRAGFSVTSGDARAHTITSTSRATARSIVYPAPALEPERFVDALLDELRRHRYDALLPMEHDTLEVVLEHRREFEELVRLPFADDESFAVFADKARTMQLAIRHGLPIAPTVIPGTVAEALELVDTLTFPVVIKPRRSWASQGIRFVEHRDDFANAYIDADRRSPLPIVQSAIPIREKLHVNVLCDQATTPIASCAVLELRHHPVATGPSTAQRVVERPELVQLAARILAANRWTGVASVDILIDDRDGNALIAEVNPRFWGSLNASIAAGVDFPSTLVGLAMGDAPAPVHGGRTGTTNRSLLPYDLLYMCSRGADRSRASGFWKFTQVSYDIVDRRDPVPTLAFFWTAVRQLGDPEAWRRFGHMDRAASAVAQLNHYIGRHT